MSDKKEVPNEIVINHLPLVKSVAFRLFSNLPSHVDFDDLIGYGVLGLIEALRSFNPEKNVKFSTYAFYRIRGAMLDGLRTLDWLPRSLRHKIRHLESTVNELKNKLGRDPHDYELAEHLKMPVEQVRTILFEAQQAKIISLEEELQANISLEDKRTKDLEEEEVAAVLVEAIKSLEEKERLVITLYYYEGLNLKEIGKVMGLSESRISQLLSKVIALLREKMGLIKSEM